MRAGKRALRENMFFKEEIKKGGRRMEWKGKGRKKEEKMINKAK